MIWGSRICAAAITHALACHFTVSILSQIGGLGLSHFAPRAGPSFYHEQDSQQQPS